MLILAGPVMFLNLTPISIAPGAIDKVSEYICVPVTAVPSFIKIIPGPPALDVVVKLNVKNLAIADVYNPEIDTVFLIKLMVYLDLKLS
jgi:hypothetical protein